MWTNWCFLAIALCVLCMTKIVDTGKSIEVMNSNLNTRMIQEDEILRVFGTNDKNDTKKRSDNFTFVNLFNNAARQYDSFVNESVIHDVVNKNRHIGDPSYYGE